MSQLHALPDNIYLHVASGETILEASLKGAIPHVHACGGTAHCSTCWVQVQKKYCSIKNWMAVIMSAMYMRSIFFYCLLIAAFPSHAQENALPVEAPFYTLLLVGDAGEPQLKGKDDNLLLLRHYLQLAGENSSVVFLGDNIYPAGLPGLGAKDRLFSESKLVAQLKALESYRGEVFFIPGNHDWDRGGRRGWEKVKIQERFVEEYLQNGNTFLPDMGCPGPVEVNLNDSITLVVIDTQWFLHPWDKPDETSDCQVADWSEVLIQLHDVLDRNKHKKVVVVSHHPMYSAGSHMGHSTWKDHIFPLTNLNNYLYFPLPVVGSLYPLYRRFFGDIQDIPNPKYQQMRKCLMEVFKSHSDIVHAAGHEHALQYFFKDSVHYVVSGSGSKETPVSKVDDAFALSHHGFGQLKYFRNGSVWLEFYIPDGTTDTGTLVYKKQLSDKPFKP